MNITSLYTVRAGLAESPLWDDINQCFYWIDIPNRQLHRHEFINDISGAHSTWQLPQSAKFDPGAIALTQKNQLIIALRSGIAVFDPSTPTGNIEPSIAIAAPYDTQEIRFNDGGVDTQGRFWIGTLFAPKTRAGASLFCLEKGLLTAIVGEHANQMQDWGVTTSNGWAIALDSTHMFHADTQAHTIYHYTYDAQAPAITALSNRQIFYKTLNQSESKEQGVAYHGRPDGAAVDSVGNYWNAQFEGGQIIQFSPTGKILQRIDLPAKCPTMVCFGGSDLKTLIITTTGNRPNDELSKFPNNGFILMMRTEIAGLPTQRYIEA